MRPTILQRGFAPVKRLVPHWVWSPIRRAATAVLMPVMYSYRTGHFRSSLAEAAYGRDGSPLPWYTYPAIDFLKTRSFSGRTVLEFGAGQSTLWWAARAARVVAMEGNEDWYERIRGAMPDNVELRLIPMGSSEECVAAVRSALAEIGHARYDVVVIDGLYRRELVPTALERVTDDGVIICDNAEGYGFYQAFRELPLQRIDFIGNAPGVVLPHSTSLVFSPGAFIASPRFPIIPGESGE